MAHGNNRCDLIAAGTPKSPVYYAGPSDGKHKLQNNLFKLIITDRFLHCMQICSLARRGLVPLALWSCGIRDGLGSIFLHPTQPNPTHGANTRTQPNPPITPT